MAELSAPLQGNLGGRYDIERELGRGGMATVYLARDLKQGRQVAVKVLHHDLSLALGAERFLREIQIASGLTHPHILPVHDSGDAEGTLFYVMPFVEGESLRDRLARERQLGVDEAVRITCEVAGGLAHAHSMGVVHRDIKPENIMIESGHAVIADFGIARAISRAGDATALTKTGMSLGTPAYMSPEQATAEKDIDGRSDIYSLACVAYEMLAGGPPFTATSQQALIARHLVDEVPLLSTVRTTIPPGVEDAILQALEKVPADRFATAQQFAEALALGLGESGSWTSKYTTTRNNRITRGGRTLSTSNRVRAPELTPWYKQSAVIAGVTLALGGGIGTTWYMRNQSSTNIRQMGANAAGLEFRRVAIQYMQDASGGKKLGALAGGLTEGLIEQLSQIQGLDVVSKSAVSAYRDSDVRSDSIAKAFKAGWLVQGTVDEDGPDVRVTAKLIDGASGGVVASETFKQPADSALVLRASLVTKISEQLRQQIGGQLTINARRLEAKNANAWLLVQQADKFRRDAEAAGGQRNTAEMVAGFTKADSLLAMAEALDKDWPEPAIQRAFVALRRGRRTAIPKEKLALYQQAISHADRVIQRGASASTAAAFEYRGAARFYQVYDHLLADQRIADETYLTALADLDQATRLAPRTASAWHTLSTAHAHKPDFSSSKLAALEAWRSDPFHLQAAAIIDRLYRTSYITETFNDADQWCATGRSRFPKDSRFIQCTLWTYTVAQIRPTPSIDTVWMLADTIVALAEPSRKEFMRREAHVVAGIVLGRLGKADSARRVLDRVMETPREADPENDLLYYNAYARLSLGDRKTALELLKTYLTRNPEHRAGLGKDLGWWWRELKNDPEFQRLIATGS